MPARNSFEYAMIRVVPRVERGEFINAGVILFCRTRRFLDARIALDHQRLAALAPTLDPALVQQYLDAILLVCAGGAAAAPLGLLPQAERFRWLAAPRSAIIQASPIHGGRCVDPAAVLDDLLQTMVKLPGLARDEPAALLGGP